MRIFPFIPLLASVALGARFQPGTLPDHWRSGGPDCSKLPLWEVHEYNGDFFILRESGCTNYEKPFLYLLFGKDRALLEDTGAGDVNTGAEVASLISHWCKLHHRDSIPLVVVHSHGHSDHTAGDPQFENRPDVEFVAASVPEIQKALDIADWPNSLGHIDLGDRPIDVIPVPGHQQASIALYDYRTGILLTGDSLYPGRLYVAAPDFPAFAASTQRLVDYTRDHPVTHILGTHIEQTRTPYVDYPRGTRYQPDEHVLELGRSDLLALNKALQRLHGKPEKVALPAMTVVVRFPGARNEGNPKQ